MKVQPMAIRLNYNLETRFARPVMEKRPKQKEITEDADGNHQDIDQ